MRRQCVLYFIAGQVIVVQRAEHMSPTEMRARHSYSSKTTIQEKRQNAQNIMVTSEMQEGGHHCAHVNASRRLSESSNYQRHHRSISFAMNGIRFVRK